MTTTILFIANFKVENVATTVTEFQNEISSFIGSRFVVENNTGMPALVVGTILSPEERVSIAERASTRCLGVVFVEGDYNVLNGTVCQIPQ